jgi:hypothetical protein
VHEELTDKLRAFIKAQPMFFVATAPSSASGHVNVSPKGGMDTLDILGPRTVAYLDLIGSGAETLAHVRENERMTMMFCSFTEKPKILRLYGRARPVLADSDEWPGLIGRFGEHPIPRSVIVVELTRISESCGFTVPVMRFVQERDLQDQWGLRRTPEQLEEYMAEKNSRSIDGLPARPVPISRR